MLAKSNVEWECDINKCKEYATKVLKYPCGRTIFNTEDVSDGELYIVEDMIRILVSEKGTYIKNVEVILKDLITKGVKFMFEDMEYPFKQVEK